MKLEEAKHILEIYAVKEAQLEEAAKIVAEAEGSVKDPDGSSDAESVE